MELKKQYLLLQKWPEKQQEQIKNLASFDHFYL